MIYFVSKGNYASGGPETIHQAAAMLKKFGHDVSVYYESPHSMTTPERLKVYGIDVVNKIIDNENNILIVPETMTFILSNFKRIKKCIWWLSLDNYLNTEPIRLVKWRMKENNYPIFLFPLGYMCMVFKRKIHRYRYQFEDNGVFYHMYNCEHAHSYIVEHGVPEERTLYLCGPLNEQFFKAAELKGTNKQRKRNVLYNPLKGASFTKALISYAESKNIDANFIPIINMKPNEIVDLMSSSMMYMDFGNFPGPERLPREAVTMGCNIITSKNGSSANTVDVPIPDHLKFDDNEENIPAILDKILDMLNNYEKYYPYYDVYRKKVRDQIWQFEQNIQIMLERI